jgi:hypothetical protein
MAGVATPDEYRARMSAHLRSQCVIPPREQVVKGAIGQLEADGFARVRCGCGNWPIVDPVWVLACCFKCGRIFESVSLPSES